MEMNEILAKYLPEKSVDFVAGFIKKNNVQLNIKRNRLSKYGDYRPPQGRYAFHRISINFGLNKYHFLLTFVHEAAHLLVWEKYKNSVASHGKEWQEAYRGLMRDFLNENYFPKELLPVLSDYFLVGRIRATTSDLSTALRKYDQGEAGLLLDEIPENAVFQIQNGMVFRKGKKLRTRYQCQELKSGREYRVSAMAEVRIVSN